MKIIVLKGSPHKNGASNTLANEFIRGAEEAGHTVESIDAAHMNIRPCLGCDACKSRGECIQKDDGAIIKNVLMAADCVVFVTPIYYFGMSAQLKTVIDRFYSYNDELTDKHLKAVLITAAWDSDADVMPYTEKHFKKISRYLNFDYAGAVLGTGCGTSSMTKQSLHMLEAYELGKRL